MPAVNICPWITQEFSDDNGTPLAGGFLYTYYAGTSTPKATYTDYTGTVENEQPITLDSAGRADIWLASGAYKFIVKDSEGVTLYQKDGVAISTYYSEVDTLSDMKAITAGSKNFVRTLGYTTINDGGGWYYYYDSESSDADDGFMCIQPSSFPATGRWIGCKPSNGEINLRVAGADCDGIADDITELQAADAYCSANGFMIFIDGDTYFSTDPSLSSRVHLLPGAILTWGNFQPTLDLQIDNEDKTQHFDCTTDYVPVTSLNELYPEWFGETYSSYPITLAAIVARSGQKTKLISNICVYDDLTLQSGDFDIGGNIDFSNSSFFISANTSDGSDTKSITICGGGSNASSRGGCIEVYGEDHSSYPGEIRLYSGTSGYVRIGTSVGGGLVVGSPTGLHMGNGTINCESAYVEGDFDIGGNIDISGTTDLHGASHLYSTLKLDGHVGIGQTASANYSLDILHGSDSNLIAMVRGADAVTEYIGFGIAANQAILTAGSAGSGNVDLVIRTTSSGSEAEVVRIDSSGNVGIGTATPDGKLHIYSASAGTVTANTNANELVLENSDNTGLSILSPDASYSTIYFGSPSDSSGSRINWSYDNNLFTIGSETANGEVIMITNNTERIRIKSDGIVHIIDTMKIGSDTSGVGDSTNTNKAGQIKFAHYEGVGAGYEGVLVDYESNTSNNTIIRIGGNTSAQSANTLEFYTASTRTTSGVLRAYIDITGGLVLGNPTGGGRGTGTLNAQSVYDDNVLLTGYVLDKYVSKFYDSSKWNAKADRFELYSDKCFNLNTYCDFIIENKCLPTFADIEMGSKELPSTGDLAQRLWEVVEIQSIHIKQLNDRLSKLEETFNM